jgi:hypothetical protein
MTLTRDYVAKLFENLSNGETSVFFDSIIDDVHWTVMEHVRLLMYTTENQIF